MFRNISPEVLLHLLSSLDGDELEGFVLANFFQNQPRQRHTRGFNLELLEDERCFDLFRFDKAAIYRLQNVLRIPVYVLTVNGLRVPGVEALCVLLRRMAYPNRLGDIAPLFRRCKADMSYIFAAALHHIYDNFIIKFTTLNHQWVDYNRLAEAVRHKDAPLNNCVGFLDGTVRPIARPIENQRAVYNGHKRTHALKYQSLMLPNGIIGHMYGTVEGRRHDAALLAGSNLLQELQMIGDFCVYGDPAYPLRNNLIVPFRGANLTPDQEEFNRQMARVRTSVEWGFGEIVKLFAFVDFKKNQKLLLQPVGKHYVVAALLYNAHNCLYGSITSKFFDCPPPTLEAYFA